MNPSTDTQRLALAGLLAILTGAPLAIALSSGEFGVRIAAYVVTGLVWLAAFVVAWPAARRTVDLAKLKAPYLRLRFGRPASVFLSQHDEEGWNCPYCGTRTVGGMRCTGENCEGIFDPIYKRVSRSPFARWRLARIERKLGI